LTLFIGVASNLQAKEVSIQYRGLMLNGNLELAEGRRLEDGVVLILHGSLGHNRMEIIEASQQALLDNDYNSLAITLSLNINNRHGFYDCTWPHRYTLDDGVDELSAWIGWLSEKGVERIVLLAHSRGANQAMIYAVEEKDPKVSHLVLLAPNTTDTSKSNYEARYGKTFDENLVRVKKLIDAGKGAELIENLDFSYCPKATVSAATFYSFNRYDDKFRRFQSYLPQIPVPTLIVVGTVDEFQPNIANDVAPFVDGKRIRLGQVENAGHFFRDLNIEEGVELAVEFITETE
jgi:pimeloyl-ACP methyl ester carboxylesterase